MLEIIFSLITLVILEAILGIDNLVFISILSSRLPADRQKSARRLGLSLAWITRLILLASVFWIISLTKPFFEIFGKGISWRDLFLILGGIFLLGKATHEIHNEIESISKPIHLRKFSGFWVVISQIAVFDIIFSLDSILTAVGLTQQFWIMALAITIAILMMILASEPLTRFIQRHPTIKMLALSFLLLIGIMLVADGLDYHIPRGYLYFAVSFSLLVEWLNSLITRKSKAKPPSD